MLLIWTDVAYMDVAYMDVAYMDVAYMDVAYGTARTVLNVRNHCLNHTKTEKAKIIPSI